jgi:hypothetical protein
MAKAKSKSKRTTTQSKPTQPAVIVTKAQQVQALSDILLDVRRKRFEIDQSSVILTEDERRQLGREYDVARDAYYKGVADMIDAFEPGAAALLNNIASARQELQALQVSQANAEKVLAAISAVVGLAAKLVVLGAL